MFVLSTLATGFDTIEFLRGRIPIDGVIGLSARDASGNERDLATIAGYREGAEAARGIGFIPVVSYGLDDPADVARLRALDMDVLLILGWQRLIPAWLIAHCARAAVGVHGSPFGITGGRGRSPQTWALLLGLTEFSLSLFAITPEPDAGHVFATARFPLTKADDIASSYRKASCVTAEMLAATYADGTLGANGVAQTGEVRYLPQRLPSDGEIDWSRSSDEIADFVRAQTRPYPGAFARAGETIVRIWRARSFDGATGALDPGRIAHRFADRAMLVGTGSGALLVDECDVSSHGFALSAGLTFDPCSFTQQMAAIVDRHNARYPDARLADAILRAAGRS